MRALTLLLILLVVVIGAFAVLNWPAFTATTTLNLLVATVTAPLGVVMLGAVAVVVAAFSVYMAFWQGRMLLEMRRHAKELQAQRVLADQAEASRFTELRAFLDGRLSAIDQRLAQAEAALRKDVHDSGNTLAAYLGEIDDRRGGRSGLPGPPTKNY